MKVLSCVFMILGCFLGAGFVSGREVASYFSKFGECSIISIVIATILFFILTLFFLLLSSKVSSFDNFAKRYFSKFYGFANILMAICVLILISSMFAGTVSLAESLNINKFIVAGITMILCFIIVIGRVQFLSKVNSFLMPFIIVILLITSLASGASGLSEGNVALSIFSGTSYVFINIVTLGLFILEIGRKYTLKQKVLIALISSMIIGVLLFILNRAILSSGVVDQVMPTLALARRNEFLYVCMQISIHFGLLTTLISNVYLLGNFVNKYIGNYYLTILVVMSLGFFISTIGFVSIVSYAYYVIGVIGVIMIVRVIVREKGIGYVPIPK